MTLCDASHKVHTSHYLVYNLEHKCEFFSRLHLHKFTSFVSTVLASCVCLSCILYHIIFKRQLLGIKWTLRLTIEQSDNDDISVSQELLWSRFLTELYIDRMDLTGDFTWENPSSLNTKVLLRNPTTTSLKSVQNLSMEWFKQISTHRLFQSLPFYNENLFKELVYHWISLFWD